MKFERNKWETCGQHWCKNIGPERLDNVWLCSGIEPNALLIRFWDGIACLQEYFEPQLTRTIDNYITIYSTIEEAKQKIDNFLTRINGLKGFW